MAFPYTFLLHVLDINKMAFYNICMFTKMIGSLEVCAKEVRPGDITLLGSHSLCAKILKASTTLITSVVLALAGKNGKNEHVEDPSGRRVLSPGR